METMDTAAPAAAARPSAEPGTYVTFELSDQVFGVPVASVREILDHQKSAHLPNAAPGCTGVIDTRGCSIPLMDLAARLGVSAGEPGPETRIIVFEIAAEGAAHPVGVVADRVLDVTQIGAEQIEPTPRAAIAGGSACGLRGLARLDGALIVLVSVDELLGDAPAMAV